jgi:hypothetical protein
MPEHPQRPRDPYGQTRPRQADRRSTQTRRGRSAVEHDNPPYRSAAGALDAGEQIRLPRPSQAAARQHVRAAHDEFGQSRAAVAATPFHLHQRRVTVAGSDQCGKLGVLGAVACLAPDVHPVARAGDRARRRQVVRHGRNGAGRGSTAETPASGAWCGHERRTEGQPCNPRPEACRPTENQRANAALAGSATQRLHRRAWDAPGSAHMSRKWFPSMKAADSLGSRTSAAARPIIKATAKTATGRNRMMCRPTTETPG